MSPDLSDSNPDSTLSGSVTSIVDTENPTPAVGSAAEGEAGWLNCILMLLVLSPMIAFLGAMRWNIANQLDRDLRFIFCWFIDAFLYFLVAYPFYLTTRNASLKRTFQRLTNGAFVAVFVAGIVALLLFVVATFVAFHYIVSELLEWIF